ncbi:MAG: hypothetical protein QXZ13_00900 [Candidatus Diapherotrites archaeon]
MNWLNVIVSDSAKIFLSEPKLIFPKLVVSFAYGFLMLYSANVISNLDFFNFYTVIFDILFLLLISFIVLFIDIVFSSMYSFLVSDFFSHKKISLVSALFSSLKKSVFVVPLVFVVILLFLLISALIQFLLVQFFGYNIYLSIILDFILVFFFVFIFYFIFPVLLLEKHSVFVGIKNSVFLSFSNWKKVSLISLLSIFLSSLSFIVAFLVDSYYNSDNFFVFAFLFVLLRFFVAYINTYIYILNPVFYFKGVSK